MDTRKVVEFMMEMNGQGDSIAIPSSPVRRPMNAFLIFCKRHRTIIRNKNINMDNRNVTRILGELWAGLAPDEKKVYTDLAQQYKDAFMKANPEYKWYNPDKSNKPSKPITRPSNSTRHVNVTARKYSDGNEAVGKIELGKLADPNKMGGLNLLLMAGKESLRSPCNVIHRVQFLDKCNYNEQMDIEQKVEPPTTEDMVRTVTSELVQEHTQENNFVSGLANGQEVVDHVIEQLYFSQRCRVNSGDRINGNHTPNTTNNQHDRNTQINATPTTGVNYSPKKEIQYRWRSMSASGQLESFKRFQSTHLSRSHEVQNFQDVEAKVTSVGRYSEKMEEETIDAQSTWKSPRANRGTRYKEMMSEGFHLKQHHRKSGSDSDEDPSYHDAEFLPQKKMTTARKRTVSESVANTKNITDKRYKTGDFDLDAELASIRPCAVDSMCKKKSSRQLSRMRHHSEGSKRQPNFTFDKSFTVGELHCDRLLSSVMLSEPNTNLVGSQKRKARKSSITHLIQVPGLEKIAG